MNGLFSLPDYLGWEGSAESLALPCESSSPTPGDGDSVSLPVHLGVPKKTEPLDSAAQEGFSCLQTPAWGEKNWILHEERAQHVIAEALDRHLPKVQQQTSV